MNQWLSAYAYHVSLYLIKLAYQKKIIALPESKEWNMREMLVQDLDGHMIRFGQRIESD